MDKRMIEVRVRHPSTMQLTPETWAASIWQQLTKGGIPALPDGTIAHGSLARFNDPDDFGVTIYRWLPDSANGDEHG